MTTTQHPSSPGDSQRTEVGGSHRTRRAANALLLAATVVFVAVTIVRSRLHSDGVGSEVLGYVRAAAEAGMVGGLADWFAVTALFRRPFGLPIPHTALIPERKAALGAGLGAFVQDNFLSPELVVDKIRAAHPAQRITDWLGDDAHRRQVVSRAEQLVAVALSRVAAPEGERAVTSFIEKRLEAVPAAPALASLVEAATADGRHHDLIDMLLTHARHYVADNADVLRGRVTRSSPWWVPVSVDEKVFQRIFGAIIDLLDDVRHDRRHVMRQTFDRRLVRFVEELRSDQDMIGRAEQWKAAVLSHPSVREWIGSLWDQLRSAVAGPDGRRLLEVGVDRGSQALARDPELRARLDLGIERAVFELVRSSGHEVADLISTTVDRWDGDDAARRIEGVVGRDLQFIRINGTVVGAIAGLLIHAVASTIG